MDAASYVQGLYTVAQRDAIFTKANKYPDAANGLQNQVPTIFPDGTVGWRQIPDGEDGTANPNIATVEDTQYASRDYRLNDLLICNGQLYVVQRPIPAGQQIDLLTDVRSTRVDLQMLPRIGKSINLLRNWYFRGGGSQQGGGQLPINQLGSTSYGNPGVTIDGWYQTGGTTTVDTYTVTHASPAGASSDFYQIVDLPVNDGVYNIPLMFGIMRGGNYYRSSAVIYNTSEPVKVFDQPEFSLWLEALPNKKVKAIVRVYAGESVALQAAKLELGTHGTLAEQRFSGFQIADPPPDYGEELRKCQRYLQIFRGGANALVLGTGFMNTGTECRFPVHLSVPMAPIQSVEAAGGFDVNVNGTWSLNASSVSLLNQQNNSAYLSCTLSSAVTQFLLAVVALATYETLILSAEEAGT